MARRLSHTRLGAAYTRAIDMWSLGCARRRRWRRSVLTSAERSCIAAELFLGLALLPGSSECASLRLRLPCAHCANVRRRRPNASHRRYAIDAAGLVAGAAHRGGDGARVAAHLARTCHVITQRAGKSTHRLFVRTAPHFDYRLRTPEEVVARRACRSATVTTIVVVAQYTLVSGTAVPPPKRYLCVALPSPLLANAGAQQTRHHRRSDQLVSAQTVRRARLCVVVVVAHRRLVAAARRPSI